MRSRFLSSLGLGEGVCLKLGVLVVVDITFTFILLVVVVVVVDIIFVLVDVFIFGDYGEGCRAESWCILARVIETTIDHEVRLKMRIGGRRGHV